ncbi:MAG: hypothetical protein RL748_1509, partial [Pseudomonadota bacterium]
MNHRIRLSTATTALLAGLMPFVVALVVLFMGAPSAAQAQGKPGDFSYAQPFFENIGDASQIPKGYVSALAQDARGFLWIGTQDGVVRYDGYRFRRFGYQPGNPASLSGNYIETLLPLPDGRLWVGTSNDGLSLYDPGTDQFTNFQHDPKQPDSIAASGVRALVADGRGGIWIATDFGLDYLAAGSQRFLHLRNTPGQADSLLHNSVQSLLLDKRGRLWVGSAGGLQRLRPDGKSFETIASASLGGHLISALFEANDGKLWLGSSDHGAAILDPDSLQVRWLPQAIKQPGHGWIKSIAQVNDQQIWLGTMTGGIRIVAASNGQLLQALRHDPALSSSLAFDEVGPLLLDRSGLLWVGSRGAGLQRFNTLNQAFRTLRQSNAASGAAAGTLAGLSHSNIKSVLELDNGQIWLGTVGNGIDILDRQTGLIGGHRADGRAGSLPDQTVLALAQGLDATVWAGTQQAGVWRLARGAREWQACPGLPALPAKRLLVARDGTVWVGLGQGMARWRAGASGFEIMNGPDGKPIRQGILALAEDSAGRIWAGSNEGLLVWQTGLAGFALIVPEPKRAGGLVSGFARGLLFDSKQRLWVATDKGLERLKSWDGKQAEFEHISTLLGQAGNESWGTIMEDQQGRIWSTRYVLDPASMKLLEYSRADGFDAGATWLGAHGKTRDGILFQGGTLGLQVIFPQHFQQWHYQPAIALTELKINGRSSGLQALAKPQPGSLQLSPEQRNFALEFAALDFSQPQKN